MEFLGLHQKLVHMYISLQIEFYVQYSNYLYHNLY